MHFAPTPLFEQFLVLKQFDDLHKRNKSPHLALHNGRLFIYSYEPSSFSEMIQQVFARIVHLYHFYVGQKTHFDATLIKKRKMQIQTDFDEYLNSFLRRKLENLSILLDEPNVKSKNETDVLKEKVGENTLTLQKTEESFVAWTRLAEAKEHTLTQEIDNLKGEIHQKELEAQSNQSQMRVLNEESDESKLRERELKTDLDRLSILLDETNLRSKNEIDALKEQIRESTLKLQKTEESFVELAKEEEAKENKLSHEIDSLKTEIHQKLMETQSHQSQVSVLNEELDESKLRERELKTDLDRLSILLDETNLRSKNEIDALKEQIRESTLKLQKTEASFFERAREAETKEHTLTQEIDKLNLEKEEISKKLLEAQKSLQNQNPFPFPSSVRIFMSKFGFNEKEMMEKIAAGKERLFARLAPYLEEGNLLQPCPQLQAHIQNDFLEVASSCLAASPDEALLFKPLLIKVFFFEREIRRLIQVTLNNMKKDFEEVNKETEEVFQKSNFCDTQRWEVIQSLWRWQKWPSFLEEFLINAFDNIGFDFKTINSSSDSFVKLELAIDNMITRCNLIELRKRYCDYGKQKILEFVTKATQVIRTWFEKNTFAQRFSYSQSRWGEDQILGDGVCNAINYRWIRYLMRNPTAVIRSEADFNTISNDECWMINAIEKSPLFQKFNRKQIFDEISGVKNEDRLKQATYLLGMKMDSQNYKGGIGPAILKRDHMAYKELISHLSSIDGLIDCLVTQHREELTTGFSGGVVNVGMSVYCPKENKLIKGHVLGLQIEPTREMYRFWDVNSGFYQYPSLKELKIAIKEYMNECYLGEYNDFRAGIYSELN